jgi:hypothetical protein
VNDPLPAAVGLKVLKIVKRDGVRERTNVTALRQLPRERQGGSVADPNKLPSCAQGIGAPIERLQHPVQEIHYFARGELPSRQSRPALNSARPDRFTHPSVPEPKRSSDRRAVLVPSYL